MLRQEDAPAAPVGAATTELAAPLDPKEHRIGEQIADLLFTDLDGRTGRLSDYAGNSALVIVIRDVGCPVSKKYGTRLAEMEKHFTPRGAAFLFVDTSAQDSVQECQDEAREFGFMGRYARDSTGTFGSHLRVRTTTDTFVLDSDRRLRYRGAIDDQIGRGVTQPAAKRQFLGAALNSVLRGKPVATPATSAPGCRLEFDHAPSATDAAPAVTWSGRVAELVQRRCQECHRPDGGGPFSLFDPADFAGRAPMVRDVIVDRVMPPWFATDASADFKNDLRLTPEERQDLLKWLQDGCPEGDPDQRPPLREWTAGWQIGTPDLVVQSPQEVKIPASGVLDYVILETEPFLDQERWVQAIQVLPEHADVVHHVLVYSLDPATETWSFIESYLPGKPAAIHPEGSGFRLAAGARLRLRLHYTPSGHRCVERTKVGLRFCATPPARQLHGRVIGSQQHFWIQPGDPGFRIQRDYTFKSEGELERLAPHMHLRGKKSIVEILFPDGRRLVPLEVDRYNPNWQFSYELAEPIHLVPGTTIRVTSIFDNSAANPFNPDPTATVRSGPQIWNEMGGVHIEWSQPNDGSASNDDAAESEDSEFDRPPTEPGEESDGGGR